MEDKIMVIVNPVSANGKTGHRWPSLEKHIKKAGVKLDVFWTKKPYHAVDLVRKGVTDKGYKKIMAVGGDGTVNEVVNGMLSEGELLDPELKLIVFSQGTGCDYIKSIGLKNDLKSIINIVKRGHVKYFDVGQVTYVTHKGEEEKRCFINVADLGIGGETIHLVENSTKVLGGGVNLLIRGCQGFI